MKTHNSPAVPKTFSARVWLAITDGPLKMAILKLNSWLTTRIVTGIETITPSCKEMTHLLSQSMDRRLLLHKRLAIWLHLTICDPCAHFAEQLAFIRKASRSILEYAEYISPTRFPESANEGIERGRKGQCVTRCSELQMVAGSAVIGGKRVGVTIECHGRSLGQKRKPRPAGRVVVDRDGIHEKALWRIKRRVFCAVSNHQRFQPRLWCHHSGGRRLWP